VTQLLDQKGVNFLVGDESVSNRPLLPYDPMVCEFLDRLSVELRSSKQAADYPDILTFAFWCRKAHLKQLSKEFDDGKSRLGLGLVFHITPSNVPVNFAFSFVFGLLSGNANLVRVPSRAFPQIDIICSAIRKVLQEEKLREIKARTAFVQYASNDQATGEFSARCQARIIWGGNQAIQSIRKFPIPERTVDIAFTDRYSFCVMDSDCLMALDEKETRRLAENFYNDTYLMDQNACSSPHFIVWQGNEREEAKRKFWEAVRGIVSEKYYLQAIHAVDKYTKLCQDAIELDNIKEFKRHGNEVYRLEIESLPKNMDALRGKCGYFYEYESDDLSSLLPIINKKYQTLTYFGVDKTQLRDFVLQNRLDGIDRIVPVGRALDMDVIWDGYDIVKSLTRIIDVK